jgi:hypothetical protein
LTVGRPRPVAAVCWSLCAAAGGGKLSGGVAAKIGDDVALHSLGADVAQTIEEQSLHVVPAAEPVGLDESVAYGGAGRRRARLLGTSPRAAALDHSRPRLGRCDAGDRPDRQGESSRAK